MFHRADQTRRSDASRATWWVACLAVPMLPGCVNLPASAMNTLVEARSLYETGQFGASKAKTDAVIRTYPLVSQTAEAYYLRALCHVELGSKSQANEDAQRCLTLSKDETLTARAHAMVGAILFEGGRFEAAAKHYAKALTRLPEEPENDLVHYNYGICLQRCRAWKAARARFAAVFQRYPGSSLAGRARRAHAWKHEFFSIQCGAFRERAKAQSMADALRRTRITARIEPNNTAGETLFSVLVGKYPTHDGARAALASIRRHAGGAFVVP